MVEMLYLNAQSLPVEFTATLCGSSLAESLPLQSAQSLLRGEVDRAISWRGSLQGK